MQLQSFVSFAPGSGHFNIGRVDGPNGIAACWGDVMANLHHGMGCVGVVTDGAFRDIPGMPDGIMMLARGEKPSHGELHMLTFGEPV